MKLEACAVLSPTENGDGEEGRTVQDCWRMADTITISGYDSGWSSRRLIPRSWFWVWRRGGGGHFIGGLNSFMTLSSRRCRWLPVGWGSDWNVLYRMQNRARRGEIGESTVRRLILCSRCWLIEMCGLRCSIGPGPGRRKFACSSCQLGMKDVLQPRGPVP